MAKRKSPSGRGLVRGKVILIGAYGSVSALGIWLLSMDSLLAKFGGGFLILFAGAGLAGLARFSDVQNTSRSAARSVRLDAIDFIRNELGFELRVPNEIIEAAALNGQIVAYNFDTPYNRPTHFDARLQPYSPPITLIGQFQVLFNYMRDINDSNSGQVLAALGIAFQKYREEYDFYPIELIFDLSEEELAKVQKRGDIQSDDDNGDLRGNVANLVETICQSALKGPHPREEAIGKLSGAHGGIGDNDEYQALMSEAISMARDGIPLDQLADRLRRS